MTRRTRTDKDVMDGSVIAGLRMEPDLAAALRLYAINQARAHGDHRAKGNVAAAARHLLREALQVNGGRHLCDREAYFQALTEARKKIAESVQP